MKFHRWVLSLVVLAVAITPARAQTGIVVRHSLGVTGVKATCLLLQCHVASSLGDPSGEVFLIRVNNTVDPLLFLTSLLNQFGVVDAEIDQPVSLIEGTAGPVPESLLDETPLPYYGASVWDGYANQPAAQIVSVQPAQDSFNVTGAGIVAVIDTGVDTGHPALVPVLVPGYNFGNNTAGGNETGTLNQSSAALLDGTGPAYLNGTTIAVLTINTDQTSSCDCRDNSIGSDLADPMIT